MGMQARQGAFKAFVASLPAFWLRRPEACMQLDPHAPLTSQGLLPDKPNELVATFSSVFLLPTAGVNGLPASAANMRPPSAFQVCWPAHRAHATTAQYVMTVIAMQGECCRPIRVSACRDACGVMPC